MLASSTTAGVDNLKSLSVREFSILAAVLLVFCSASIIVTCAEDSDAALGTFTGGSNQSTASNPYTGINSNVADFLNANGGSGYTMYVEEGSSLHLYVDRLQSPMPTVDSIPSWVKKTSATTASGAKWDGTVPDSGTYTFTIRESGYSSKVNITLSVVQSSTPVSSISISGSSSGEVGDTITLTASVSPSNATNKAVTWSITSGASYASITSQNDSSCTISLTGSGSITVRATADDGSGVTASKTITISEPEVLVTSVSISGPSSGDVGDTITLTATTSPSSADNRHVTWSITSGSSRATIISQTDTTTGGSCTIELENAGSITVRATADDNSGKYASKTITIEDPTNNFTLAYSGNGGSGVPSSQSGTSTSSSYSFTIPATIPSRSGYTFVEWNTRSSGTGTGYDPGDRITVSPGTTTLYAIWEQTTYTCRLNYFAPGATNVPSDEIFIGTSTSNHLFTISSQEPVKSGYIFKGWSTSSVGGAQYQPGDTISVGYNSTKSLYAVWESASLEITSTQGDVTLTVGDGFNYSVITNVNGCNVDVSGADWLTVSGMTVSGTPTAPGSFDVTVTISKAGYTSDSQSFTITVVSALGFTSVPTNGLVVVEV